VWDTFILQPAVRRGIKTRRSTRWVGGAHVDREHCDYIHTHPHEGYQYDIQKNKTIRNAWYNSSMRVIYYL
jgi:hypothetical protein